LSRLSAAGVCQLGGFCAVYADAAAKAAFQQTGGLQQRGLAGTRRPQQRDDFALLQLQVHAAQHVYLHVALPEAAGEAGELQRQITHSEAP
jgi:hypothetical protein